MGNIRVLADIMGLHHGVPLPLLANGDSIIRFLLKTWQPQDLVQVDADLRRISIADQRALVANNGLAFSPTVTELAFDLESYFKAVTLTDKVKE